jgi:hypothetical protein
MHRDDSHRCVHKGSGTDQRRSDSVVDRGSGERNSIDEPIQRTQANCGKSIVIRQLLVMRLGTCE